MPPKIKLNNDENIPPYNYLSEALNFANNNRNAPSYKYTPEEFECLRQTLNQKLGPEFLSTRPGPAGSGKLTYIEGSMAMNLANDIFGFNGWSSSVVGVTVDFVDIDNGRVSLGLSAVVRITLKDGTYHEDIGYGHMENSKSKASAFEKAKKEAVTDGIKRALRHFGDLLGNCLYDKKFCKDIAKVPSLPQVPIKVETLYRKPVVAPQRTLSLPSSSSVLPNTTTKATSFLNDNSKESGANVAVLETENNDEFEDNDDDEFSRMAGIFFDEKQGVDVNVTPAPTTHRNSLSGGSDKKTLGMPPQGLTLKTFVPTTGQDSKAVGKLGTTQNRQFIPQLPPKGSSDISITNPPPVLGTNINTGNGGSSMGPPVVNQSCVNSRPLNSQAATANQQQNYNGNKLSMPGSLGAQGQSQGYRPQPPVLNKSTTGGGGPNGGGSGLSLSKRPSSVGGTASLVSISSGVGNGGPNGGSGVSSSVGGPTSLAGLPASIPSGAGGGGPNGESGVRQPSSVGAPASAGSLASIPSGTGSGDVMVSKGTKRPSSMNNIGTGMKAMPGGGADPWFPNSAVETVNTGVGLIHGDGSTGAIKRLKQG